MALSMDLGCWRKGGWRQQPESERTSAHALRMRASTRVGAPVWAQMRSHACVLSCGRARACTRFACMRARACARAGMFTCCSRAHSCASAPSAVVQLSVPPATCIASMLEPPRAWNELFQPVAPLPDRLNGRPPAGRRTAQESMVSTDLLTRRRRATGRQTDCLSDRPTALATYCILDRLPGRASLADGPTTPPLVRPAEGSLRSTIALAALRGQRPLGTPARRPATSCEGGA